MFTALTHDQVIDSDDDMDVLLERLLGFWELVTGEDVVVWFNELAIAAVIIGAASGPQIHKFPMQAAAPTAA